jgi:RimJ/RimL family protein N-acetyltransferase
MLAEAADVGSTMRGPGDEAAGVVRRDGTVVLETPRRSFRSSREDDLPVYAALNVDPVVTRFLGGPLSSQDPDGIAEWAQELFDREGIGLLAVERREDGVFMGMCGLHHFHAYPDEIEIGFRFARSYWGHGYCTEAATAWLDHGFRSLGLPRVISIADREDPRSLAVMRRLGMSLDHEAELEDGGERFRAVIYSISSEAWLARTC